MTTVIDLKHNRDLLDPSFPGYRLSLDSIPVYERNLTEGVACPVPADHQFSLAHATIFSMHNNLHINPFSAEQESYFIDEKWAINQCWGHIGQTQSYTYKLKVEGFFTMRHVKWEINVKHVDSLTSYPKIAMVSVNTFNRFNEVIKVGVVPNEKNQQDGRFPSSILFPRKDLAVVCTGNGSVHFAKVENTGWNFIMSEDVMSCPSTMPSAICSDSKVTVVLRSIVDDKFHSILNIVTWDDSWKIVSNKIVKFHGSIEYIALESSTHLLVISQFEPKFSRQSEDTDKPKYQWTQTTEDITAWTDIETQSNPNIKVNLDGLNLCVTVNEKDIIKGELFTEADVSKWTFERGRFSLNLQKRDADVLWSEMIKGDETGIEVEIAQDVTSDSIFTDDLIEDVDISNPSWLFRIDLNKGLVSHKIDLATSQFLFALSTESFPAICLKHLSDALLWQLKGDGGNWRPEHIATLAAFAHTQASKTQRKYIVSPSDSSYAVIVDAFRHLYIYRQPSELEGTLRNRTTGEVLKSIGRLHLVNLEVNGEILGARAIGGNCFVLTKNKVFVVVINLYRRSLPNNTLS